MRVYSKEDTPCMMMTLSNLLNVLRSCNEMAIRFYRRFDSSSLTISVYQSNNLAIAQ